MRTTPNAPVGRLLTAMVTPFTPDGSALDLRAAAAVATHLVDAGCDGLVVSGTTGESPTTSDSEKADLVRAVVDAVGDRAHVVAGVGTNDTAHTVHLAQQAEKAGARALLVVSPYYSKPSQAGLAAHVEAVADATGLPVVLYDIPGRTGVAFSTETLCRVGEHPRVVGVKDAKDDLFAASEVMARTDLAYYSGSDQLNLPWLAVGAAGFISVVAHAAAASYRRMIDAHAVGDVETARTVHENLLSAVRGIMTRMPGAVAAKAAVHLAGVLEHRSMRLPLVAATDEEVRVLRTDLEEATLL